MRAPDARLPYANAMRHYARAAAYAALRNRAGFDRELGQLNALRRSGDFKAMIDQGVPAMELLQLADTVARARWAYSARNYAESARLYREAISTEGKITYMEPPWWYYPVHQSLGAALYRAGKYAEAQEAFTAALARSPNNGWALFGLAASEKALGNRERAAAANMALKKAWAGNPAWLRMDRL
jgi:tetratricopeptide (TPR) repeat protein